MAAHVIRCASQVKGIKYMLKGICAAAALVTTLLVTPGSAPAQTPTGGAGLSIPVTGRLDGKNASGIFTLRRFEAVNGAVHAVGTLTMSWQNRTAATVVSVPVNLSTGSGAKKASAISVDAALDAVAPAQSCDILNLTLGPLDLNLLGLRIQLDQVNLDITGETGAGNLLGNLLCAVAGLLDPQSPLDQLIATLNQLLTRLLGFLG
jgi:hypothetical protein